MSFQELQNKLFYEPLAQAFKKYYLKHLKQKESWLSTPQMIEEMQNLFPQILQDEEFREKVSKTKSFIYNVKDIVSLLEQTINAPKDSLQEKQKSYNFIANLHQEMVNTQYLRELMDVNSLFLIHVNNTLITCETKNKQKLNEQYYKTVAQTYSNVLSFYDFNLKPELKDYFASYMYQSLKHIITHANILNPDFTNHLYPKMNEVLNIGVSKKDAIQQDLLNCLTNVNRQKYGSNGKALLLEVMCKNSLKSLNFDLDAYKTILSLSTKSHLAKHMDIDTAQLVQNSAFTLSLKQISSLYFQAQNLSLYWPRTFLALLAKIEPSESKKLYEVFDSGFLHPSVSPEMMQVAKSVYEKHTITSNLGDKDMGNKQEEISTQRKETKKKAKI